MSNNLPVNEELIRQITRTVIKNLIKMEKAVVIGVSNRHIHLSREDMDVLFGKGSELTKMKDLIQPGQYACEETVNIRGPKGELKKVRILGPLRPETQIEVSVTDGFSLGVKAPVRESGQLDNTPGIEIIGPKGSVSKSQGVIAAYRHIHMTLADAKRMGVSDGDLVSVEVGTTRGAVLNNVLVRASDKYALEMHIDIDEANGLGVKTGDNGYIL